MLALILDCSHMILFRDIWRKCSVQSPINHEPVKIMRMSIYFIMFKLFQNVSNSKRLLCCCYWNWIYIPDLFVAINLSSLNCKINGIFPCLKSKANQIFIKEIKKHNVTESKIMERLSLKTFRKSLYNSNMSRINIR